MKITQQTADELREEIDLLSTSKNQHQQDLEATQKELKSADKLLDERKKDLINYGKEIEKLGEEREGAKNGYAIALEKLTELEKSNMAIDDSIQAKKLLLLEAEENIIELRSEYAIIKSALVSSVDKLKDDIAKNCDKIKNLL